MRGNYDYWSETMLPYLQQNWMPRAFPDYEGLLAMSANKAPLTDDDVASYAVDMASPFAKVGGLFGIIAGKGARTADLGLLGIAKQSEGKLPRRKIYDATGWWKGKDGEWRFEIDDSQMNLKQGLRSWEQEYPNYADFNVEHSGLFAAYPDAKKVLLQKDVDNVLGYGGAAYVPADQLGRSAVVFGKMPDDAYTKSTIGHEFQHYIQANEGFARGGNPETAQKMAASKFLEDRDLFSAGNKEYLTALSGASPYWRADHIEDFNKILRKENPTPKDVYRWADWYEHSDEIRRKYGSMPKKKGIERTTWIRNAIKHMQDAYIAEDPIKSTKALGLLDEEGGKGVKNALRRYDRKLDKYREEASKYSELTSDAKGAFRDTPKNVYRRLAGEVEARNTERRINLSPDDRRMLPPFESNEFLAYPENLQYLPASRVHPALRKLLGD